MANQAPFVINPALVGIVNDYSAINARQRGYIADLVLPRTPVTSPEFKYVEYPIEEAFDVVDTQVDRRSKPNELVFTATEATGAVKDYGLDAPVPYRDERAASGGATNIPFALRARAGRIATDKVQLAREIRAASLIFSAGNYLTGYKATLTGGGQMNDTAVDPVALINDAIAGMLVKPNTLVTSIEVLNVLRRRDKVSVALGGSAESGRWVSTTELAGILGVENIVVGNTMYQTSKKGQAMTTAKIWGKHLALINVAPAGSTGTVDDPTFPGFGYTFQWGERVAGEIEDPDMGLLGGVRVRSGEFLTEQKVAPYAGYLFTNAIA